MNTLGDIKPAVKPEVPVVEPEVPVVKPEVPKVTGNSRFKAAGRKVLNAQKFKPVVKPVKPTEPVKPVKPTID